ncbi:unnamed protein product [Clonostachys chloroleuca]|uniref:Oxidoreductase acuF-like C2H2 type zinc-finger domain-containing protein n=1 Tax=Clonostachys chloroleuca TaxID=1926264 RepID=A0AA35LSW8_9HYPO|nr:unnamed protein product [Clonostachys chloroleuca]
MGLHSSISNLFSLAMLIRRDRPKGRRLDSRRLVSLDKTADIIYVEDRFPKLRQTPWLAQHLWEAISYSREYICYRQTHRQRLQRTTDLSAPNDDTQTLATTFKENRMDSANESYENQSVFSAGTSHVSTGTNTSELRVPDLSNMILDGIRLDYGQYLECPYCRTVQKPLDRHEWKKHVFQNLEPYVCLFEDCSFKLLETRREWYEHETTFHGRHFSCRFCSTLNPAIYGTESEMNCRFLYFFKHANRGITHLETSSCPFCSEWKADSNAETMKGYYRHISEHLQPLALASISLVIDGLEIINEEETRRSEDLRSEQRVAAKNQDASEMTNVMNFVMKPFQEIQAKARIVISNLEKTRIGPRSSIAALHQANLELETEGRVTLQTIEPLCIEEVTTHRAEIHRIIWDFDYINSGSSGVDTFITLQKRSNNALPGIMNALQNINAKFEEEKFDSQKLKIIESCFNSGSDSSGSYIHHVALLEGSMLCIHVSNSGEIQISHLTPDDETGGFSNDMTWDFEKIDAVQGPSEFQLPNRRAVAWMDDDLSQHQYLLHRKMCLGFLFLQWGSVPVPTVGVGSLVFYVLHQMRWVRYWDRNKGSTSNNR